MKTLLRAAVVCLASTILLSACSPGSSDASTDEEKTPPVVVTKSPKESAPTVVPFEADASKRAPAKPAAGATGGTTGTSDKGTTKTPAGGTGTKPATSPRSTGTSRARSGTYSPTEYVLMETSMGDIVLALDHERAPVSVENFLGYAETGFYEGTIFHRVIRDFVIQGGGLTPDLLQKETDNPIVNEWRNGLKNVRGSIAMARLPKCDSATSQFYINVKDNAQLDIPQPECAYAVVGNVIAGIDVVDRIGAVDTGQKGNRLNVPIVDVLIKRVTRISESDAKQRTPAGAADE